MGFTFPDPADIPEAHLLATLASIIDQQSTARIYVAFQPIDSTQFLQHESQPNRLINDDEWVSLLKDAVSTVSSRRQVIIFLVWDTFH